MTDPSTVQATMAAFLEKLRTEDRLPQQVIEAITRLANEEHLDVQARLREAVEVGVPTQFETEEA